MISYYDSNKVINLSIFHNEVLGAMCPLGRIFLKKKSGPQNMIFAYLELPKHAKMDGWMGTMNKNKIE